MKTKFTIPVQLHPFVRLWASQSLSAMGTEMTNYALIIWTYSQTQSASDLTTLTLCAFLPTILFRFFAGAVADRWSKKVILLVSDLAAAFGTLTILTLYTSAALTVTGLYVINFLLSLMNAFQVPAAYVATSLLVPEAYYTRAGGLQSASGALISILSPVLGSLLLALGGLELVLCIDLLTFAVAFLTLLFLQLPSIPQDAGQAREPFWQSVASGFRFLQQHPPLLRMILLIAFVNFLAKLGPDGQMSAFILSRTGSNQAVLGAVQSAVALGLLAGSTLVISLRPPRRDTNRILFMCTMIFLAGIFLAVSRHVSLWCLFAFLQYMCAAVMNICWGTKMRTAVPLHMQGRVFSTRDTIQNCTIPLGLYLGGILTDRVFEPLMAQSSALRQVFTPIVGTGSGGGIALLFLLVAVIGFCVCGLCIGRKSFLDDGCCADRQRGMSGI